MEGDWVSITDAAVRLTATGDAIDRSTLSRYIKQHAEALPTKQSGKANLVDFDLLSTHRAENIRLHTTPRQAPPDQTPAPRANTQADAAARDRMAVAEMREMDLAKRRGELTITAEVTEAGQSALVLMQGAFERAVETEAASLSLKYGWDERTVRVALKSFARTGVDVFHRELLGRLDARRRARDAGDEFGASAATALQ